MSNFSYRTAYPAYALFAPAAVEAESTRQNMFDIAFPG